MAGHYTKPELIDLKASREYDERWVQEIIAKDPLVLGLGDVVLRDRERVQPSGGRLDLLLQSFENNRRFEVELQLGPTDESHIIRTIEYWDIERKRYPQYDHCAVLVAEQVTSRFLNVISLFNGALPLIAVQMQAFAVGEHVTLVFTKVLDELVRGLVNGDEDAEAAPTDRGYWENRSSKESISLADGLVDMIHKFDEGVELKYTKHYIGLSKDGRPFNFVSFVPRKKGLVLQVSIPEGDQLEGEFERAGIDSLGHYRGSYRLRITKSDLPSKSDFLEDLMKRAHTKRSSN
ncbi:MAG: DUF5655 domain-containing protein [Gammaproteobacteria bacterium]|nr:DUF5655 domain-containing protein [Gammaproteobacteria bacterium]